MLLRRGLKASCLLLILHIIAVCSALECQVSNTIIQPSTVPNGIGLINTNCSAVLYVNVTFSGPMNITATLAASVTNMTFLRCFLVNGSSLTISASREPVVPAMFRWITVDSLSSNDGAVRFQGSFPAMTNIRLSRSNMLISDAGPRFQPDGGQPAAVLLIDLTLQNQSTLQISGCAVSASQSAAAVVLTRNISVISNSSLWLSGNTLAANTCPLLVTNSTLHIHNDSVWSTADSNLTSLNVDSRAITVQRSSISSTSHSLWIFARCSIVGPQRGAHVDSTCSILVQNYSSFVLLSVNISGYEDAFSVEGRVELERFSSWIISGPLTNLSSSRGSGVAMLLGSQVSIQDSSMWKIVGCLMQGNYSCFFLSGKLTTRAASGGGGDSTLTVSSNSSWIFQASTFQGSQNAFTLDVGPNMTITNGSFWSLVDCNFSANISTIKIQQAMLVLSADSIWLVEGCRVVGNSTAIGLFGINFQLLDRSRWITRNNLLVAPYGLAFQAGILEYPSKLLVNSNSRWELLDNNISSEGGNAFVAYAGTQLIISERSAWLLARCILSCSLAGGGFPIFMSGSATVANESMMVIDSCSLSSGQSVVGLGAPGFPFSFQILEASQVIFNNTLFTTTSAYYTAFSIFSAQILVDDGSLWKFEACNISSPASALTVVSVTLFRIDRGSSLVIQSCIISSGLLGVAAIGLLGTALSILQGSSWLVQACTIQHNGFGSGAAVGFLSTNLTVSNSSSLSFRRCNLTSASLSSLTFTTSSMIHVSTNSSLELSDCYLTSLLNTLEFSVTAVLRVEVRSQFRLDRCILMSSGPAASSFAMISGSRLVVANLSLVEFSASTFLTTGGVNSFLVKDSVLSIVDASAFVVARCMLQLRCNPTADAGVILLFSTGSVMRVANSSWVRFHANEMKGVVSPIGSSSACLTAMNFGGILTLSSSSSFSVTDSNCTTNCKGGGADDLFVFSSTLVTSLDGTGVFHERCNTVNGHVVHRRSFPRGAAALECGVCSTRVDCFLPLSAKPEPFSFISCSSTGFQCSCLASCGGTGETCLPGNTFPETDISSCRTSLARPLLGTVTDSHLSSPTLTVTESLSDGPITDLQSKKAVSRAAAWTASATLLLSGASVSSAVAVQRAMALRTLSQCGADPSQALDVFSSPTQICFGIDDGRCFRGAVLGNILLLLVCALGAVAVTAVTSYRKHLTMSAAAASLGLPGQLLVPYNVLSLPTLTSGALLIFSTPQRWDALIGLAGVGAVLAPLGAWLVLTATSRFAAKAVTNPLHDGSAVPLLLREVRNWLFQPLVEWKSRQGSKRTAREGGGPVLFVEQWAPLFDAYVRRRTWFGTVEAASGLLMALFSGVVSTSPATCLKLIEAACAVNVMFLLSLALRPYNARFDALGALINAMLNVAAAIVAVSNADVTTVTNVQVAASAVITALSLVQLILERMDERSAGESFSRPRDSTLPREALERITALNGSDPQKTLVTLIDIICLTRGRRSATDRLVQRPDDV